MNWVNSRNRLFDDDSFIVNNYYFTLEIAINMCVMTVGLFPTALYQCKFLNYFDCF